MKTNITILTCTVLLVAMFTFSAHAADKSEKKAQKKMAGYTQVLPLSDDEKAQIYQLLLEEQKLLKSVKRDYKGDKGAFKTASKPIKAQKKNEITAIIGSKRMDIYLASLKK